MIELCCEYLSVRCIWMYALVMSRTRFRVNPYSIVSWMSRNTLLETVARNRRDIWSSSDCNWTRTQNQLIRKQTLTYLAKLAKWLSCVVSTYLNGAFDCIFLSCQYAFHRESTLYSCLNFKRCLKFKWLQYRAYFEQGVPWLSGNYRVWIHSETHTWHDKNIQ